MIRVYLENKGSLELIRYEDFMDGKVEAIDDLASRLNLTAECPIEDQVDRQFQPRGQRRDVDWLTFFGERNLKRVETHCVKEMRALGYTTRIVT